MAVLAIDSTLMSDTLYPNGRTGTGERLGVWLFNYFQPNKRRRESGDCHAKTMMNREACEYEAQR